MSKTPPAARPASVRGGAVGPSGPGRASARPTAGVRVVSPALVGRSAELDILTAVVCSPPGVAVVEGEAGAGKTRLLTELLGRSELAGRVRLSGRCLQLSEGFPLGAVLAAVTSLGARLRRPALTPLAGALRPLLPELADFLPPAPPALDDGAAERHRVFRGLVEVLGSLGPAVLVLDDVHWADDQTVDFLTYLLANPPDELGLVLSFRGEEVAPGVGALTARLSPSVARREVTLRPFDEAETSALAAAILGIDAVPAEFAHDLHARTGGLPFAIEEVLALLQARGSLVHGDDRPTRRSLADLEVPGTIRDSTLERVRRLSADALAVARAAAVLQVPVPVDVLLATARVDRTVAAQALERLLVSSVLVEHADERVGFRHVLAAQAVHDAIAAPARYELHGHTADVLRALPAPPLGQVAHHLRHAGRLDEWAIVAEAAAEQAVELAHPSEAVRLLDDVVRHAGLDAERRGRLAVQLGWAAMETLHVGEVVDVLSDVLEGDLPPPVRGELSLLLALALRSTRPEPARMRRLLAAAAEDLGDRPDLQVWAMMCLAVPTGVGGVGLDEHLRWLRAGLDRLAGIDDPPIVVRMLGHSGATLASIGDPEWRRHADRVQRLTGYAPRGRDDVNAYFHMGVEAAYAGHHEAAEGLLRAGLAAPFLRENHRMEVLVRSGLAVLAYCGGNWDGLDDEVTVLLDAMAELPRNRIDLEAVACGLALAHGDVDGVRRRLTALIELTEEFGSAQVLSLAADIMVRAALAQGDAGTALSMARRCLALSTSKGVLATAARALPAAVDALIAAGHRDDAHDLVAGVEPNLRLRDAPLAPGALHYVHGALNGSAASFRDAAAAYREIAAPYEAARAEERAAGLLLSAGDDGASPLRSAVAEYDRLGATWDRSRAAGLARRWKIALPGRRAGGRRSYGNALSPREREVAELANAGLSNKEIAAELYIAVGTVEKHMFATMRKLGVRSRRELAHWLGEGGAEKDSKPSP